MNGLGFVERLLGKAEVEWMSLRDVAEYSRSRVDAEVLDQTSFVGVDNLVANKGGRVDASYLPNTARLTAYEQGDILIGNIRPYLKKVWRAINSGGCSGDVLAVRIKEQCKAYVNSEFLYYLLSSEHFFSYNMQHAKGAKMPRGDKSAILDYQLPIPCPENPERSLQIQAEITQILDTFTSLTTELTTELTARTKQYNYYRDKLLSFEDGEVKWRTLDKLFDMRAGQHIPASKIASDQDESNIFPCFGGNGVRGYVVEQSHEGEFAIIGRQGALCGNIQRVKGKFYATEHAVVVKAKSGVNIDWAYHLLTVMNLNQYASKSAQPGLAVGKLKSLPVPLPPLDTQVRIAAILDKFDALTNSITEGLPREIELRQKQYEYYRDLLLSFPKPDEQAA